MRIRFQVGLLLAAISSFLVGFHLQGAYAQCNQNCIGDTHFCETDANGACKANRCYFYYGTSTTDYIPNCWPCGTGPGNGWCQGGNGGNVCGITDDPINWQFTDSCLPNCANHANTNVIATGGGAMVGGGNGKLFICQASVDGD